MIYITVYEFMEELYSNGLLRHVTTQLLTQMLHSVQRAKKTVERVRDK
jgi:hypothetical protein